MNLCICITGCRGGSSRLRGLGLGIMECGIGSGSVYMMKGKKKREIMMGLRKGLYRVRRLD